jgi:RNA polymerase sigma factor (sigma-70 family)
MNAELASQLETLHADAHGWALHCCEGDRSRAEDVLQNAYVKLLQGQARRDPDSAGTFKTWWFGVIRFTAREESRRQRFRDSLPGRWLRMFGDRSADPRPSPARRLELDERSRRLREALAELPARQAETLHLVFYQDLSIAEAADVMGVSLGSARQHYERGKARLRTLLEPALITEA